MARSKADLFSNEQADLAAFAKCLSHPARIAIVKILRDNPEASCGCIVDQLPLAQPTVSQHLKAMVEGGLLKAKASGPMTLYSLNHEHIAKFCSTFQMALGKNSE